MKENRLGKVVNTTVDHLFNFAEDFVSKEFSLKEGTALILFGFSALFGITAVLGAINNRIDLLESVGAASAISGAVAFGLNKIHRREKITNTPPQTPQEHR
jgi:hypothetical protein